VFYLLREPFDDLFGDGGTTVLEFAQLRELAIQNSWIWPVTRRPARGRALRNAKQKHLRIVFPSSRATQPPKNNRHFFFFLSFTYQSATSGLLRGARSRRLLERRGPWPCRALIPRSSRRCWGAVTEPVGVPSSPCANYRNVRSGRAIPLVRFP
jgi:hypothetical protein